MGNALDQLASKVKTTPTWEPTEESFRRLLKWLDGEEDSQGRKYEDMRRRLMSFFDRKNCRSPETLTDLTFDRVSKWLEESGKEYDDEPAKVCYQTAKYVLHEYWRRSGREIDDGDSIFDDRKTPETLSKSLMDEEEQLYKEKQLDCLEHCIQNLTSDDQQLITRYYYGERRIKLENRKIIARDLGITANALSIKALRIRSKLFGCLSDCLVA